MRERRFQQPRCFCGEPLLMLGDVYCDVHKRERDAERRAKAEGMPDPGPEQPRWNGEPVDARRGSVIVADRPGSPQLYWATDLIGMRVAAVRIEYFGSALYILDHDGRGWAKVLAGGSPHAGHCTICDVDGSTWRATRLMAVDAAIVDAALEAAEARAEADPKCAALLAAMRERFKP